MDRDGIKPLVSLSVVSHAQGPLVCKLLQDLQSGLDLPFEVILTLNLPEDERFIEPFIEPQGVMPLRIIRNTVPKGFGANHNAAFKHCRCPHFVVVNPDIQTGELRLGPLIETLRGKQRVAACGPAVLSTSGQVEDSARRFPSLGRLLRRVVLRQRRPEYNWTDMPIEVDWLAGMFVVFDRDAFEAVGGFDERYFMYFEDADICRRLVQAGWRVRFDPRTSVIHDAQRASHKSLRHLRWHLHSAIRFLLSS